MRTRHLLNWSEHFQISCLFELWCWILQRELSCSCCPTNRLWFLFVWAKVSCYPLFWHSNHNIQYISVFFLIIEFIAMPCRHRHYLVWSIVIRYLFTEHFWGVWRPIVDLVSWLLCTFPTIWHTIFLNFRKPLVQIWVLLFWDHIYRITRSERYYLLLCLLWGGQSVFNLILSFLSCFNGRNLW